MIVETFPNDFARSLGEECKLLTIHNSKVDVLDHIERNSRMRTFQQMAMRSNFEDCLIAFHGFKLTKKQLEVLETIYKYTLPWVLGYATNTLIKKLESPMTTGKDAKGLNEAITEHASRGSVSGGNGSGFNVHTTQRKD